MWRHHFASAQVGAQVGAREGEEEAGTASGQVESTVGLWKPSTSTGRQGAVLHRRRECSLKSGQSKQSNNIK